VQSRLAAGAWHSRKTVRRRYWAKGCAIRRH